MRPQDSLRMAHSSYRTFRYAAHTGRETSYRTHCGIKFMSQLSITDSVSKGPRWPSLLP